MCCPRPEPVRHVPSLSVAVTDCILKGETEVRGRTFHHGDEALMQIFLTGGTGFIGQALARAVRERGWSLRVLVRDPTSVSARWLIAQGAELVHGDVTVR